MVRFLSLMRIRILFWGDAGSRLLTFFLVSPGRFTAAYQMKTMLAYLIVTYDMKTDKELHPLSGFFEKGFSANLEAKVHFRKRRNDGLKLS